MKKLALTTTIFLLFGSGFSFAESNNITKEAQESEKDRNYYVRSKSYSSSPESDPPKYVYPLNETGIAAFENIDWIEAGLSYRARFEHRKNDFRRNDSRTDNPVLTRTQAYLGITKILDPLRFALEIQDARRNNSKYPKSTGDVNETNIFQAYAELYFKNLGSFNRQVSLRMGRMAFEELDRKLIARDDWGNTGTNFQGFRAILGTQENDWQLDSFALQPITKSTNKMDHPNQDQWFYGSVMHWRRWSEIVTLQPFYFFLDQQKSTQLSSRKIHSPGLRFYGEIGNSGVDYSWLGIYQFGESNYETHRAYAHATEIGYTHQHKWQPRFSLTYGYASGDKNPYDQKNQRFERFYGFNRPWSNSNTIEWENLNTIKSRIEFQPHQKLRAEASYSVYRLASKTDSWERGNMRDENGTSGNNIGRDFDARLHYNWSRNLSSTLGYAHFIPGKFARQTGRNETSDFVYLELNFSLFGSH